MSENMVLHQVTNERVWQPMIDATNVEAGLRMLINQRHHAACMARRERERPELVERLDRDYEQALETYRRVTGKEPIAA